MPLSFFTPDVAQRSADRSGSTSASAPRKANFQNSFTISKPDSKLEEAAKVTLSKQERAREDAQGSAAIKLSNAASFVNIADDAAEQIQRLVELAKKNTESIENEASSGRKAQLAQEGAALLAEIDSVVSRAELHGSSVVNAGKKSFSFDISVESPTGDSTFSASVSNVAVSRSDLGLSDVDATDFEEDPSSVRDTLTAAGDNLSNTRASLESSSEQLSSIAKQVGVEAGRQSESEGQLSENTADALARRIAESIRDSVQKPETSLNSNAVGMLLANEPKEKKPEEENSKAQTAAERLSPSQLISRDFP
jgi:hypothetical protein